MRVQSCVTCQKPLSVAISEVITEQRYVKHTERIYTLQMDIYIDVASHSYSGPFKL